MAYPEVGAIEENTSVTYMKRAAPFLIQKSYLEMIKVIFNIFTFPYKPLQIFNAVSAPFLYPEIEEKKLLKYHNYTQKTQCLVWANIFGVR